MGDKFCEVFHSYTGRLCIDGKTECSLLSPLKPVVIFLSDTSLVLMQRVMSVTGFSQWTSLSFTNDSFIIGIALEYWLLKILHKQVLH